MITREIKERINSMKTLWLADKRRKEIVALALMVIMAGVAVSHSTTGEVGGNELWPYYGHMIKHHGGLEQWVEEHKTNGLSWKGNKLGRQDNCLG